MQLSVLPTTDRDTARGRYIAPGVLEIKLRGRIALAALRAALRETEILAEQFSGARQVLIDAAELVTVERAVPGALAQWLGAYAGRYEHTAVVCCTEMVRVMFRAVAASAGCTNAAIVSNRAEALTHFDDMLIRRALRTT